jgi:hypothetical protein
VPDASAMSAPTAPDSVTKKDWFVADHTPSS